MQAAQAHVEEQLAAGAGGIHTSNSLPTSLQRERMAAAADLTAAAREYEEAEAAASSAQRYAYNAQSAVDKVQFGPGRFMIKSLQVDKCLLPSATSTVHSLLLIRSASCCNQQICSACSACPPR